MIKNTTILLFLILWASSSFAQDRYESFPTWLKSVPIYGIDGMKNTVTQKSNLAIIGAAGISAVIAYQFDDEVQEFAVDEGLLPDNLSQVCDLYGGFWSAWLLPASVVITSQIENKSNRQMLADLEYTASALVANVVTTEVLKRLTKRTRPNGSDNQSMPSGHTSQSFVVAAVADELYGHKIGVPAYIFAGLVAVSRINDNKHYLSDVIVGAGLGTIIGRGFAKTYNRNKYTPSFSLTNNGFKIELIL